MGQLTVEMPMVVGTGSSRPLGCRFKLLARARRSIDSVDVPVLGFSRIGGGWEQPDVVDLCLVATGDRRSRSAREDLGSGTPGTLATVMVDIGMADEQEMIGAPLVSVVVPVLNGMP